MVLKKFLIIGLLVLGIAAAAVLLFFAGDHDDEYRNSVSSADRLRVAGSQGGMCSCDVGACAQ